MENIAVIGVGSLLMQDDGVGIHAIQALETMELPEGVELYDCSTNAFWVLEAMDKKDKAIIIDAYIHDTAPGTVTVFPLDPDNFEDAPNLSMHDFNFIDALKSGKDAFQLPRDITVIGVEPTQPFNVDDKLTPTLEKAMPGLIDKVLELINGE